MSIPWGRAPVCLRRIERDQGIMRARLTFPSLIFGAPIGGRSLTLWESARPWAVTGLSRSVR
jgi:hypothetical protein